MKVRTISLCFCLLSLCVLTLPQNSEAAGNVMITPSIQIQDGYDSNISFTKIDEERDFYTVISPAFVMDYASELLKFSSKANMDMVRYTNEKQRNYDRWQLAFNGDYKLLERSQASFALSYVNDTTLQSELEETGLVYIRSDRQRYLASGGFSHQMSERSNIGFNYTHTKTEYEWTGNVDYDTDGLTFHYVRQLANQRDSITIQPSYSKTDSRANKVDTYSLSLGWSHAFSETAGLSMSLGGRHTTIRSRLVQPQIIDDPTQSPPYQVIYNEVDQSEKKWGAIADLSLKKKGERYSAAIGYNHDISYTSLGEPIERDKIYLNISFMITERTKTGFSGSLYFNRSESESYEVDSRYYQVRSFLSYQITRNGSLQIEYNYADSTDFILTGDNEAIRHRVLVSLSFGFPKAR